MAENIIAPDLVLDYFDEVVNNETPFKGNKFTFLSNIGDPIYYIFEEFYIREDDEEPEEPEETIPVNLTISSNIYGFSISLIINGRKVVTLPLINDEYTYSQNLQIGDNVSYTSELNGYYSVSDSIVLSDENNSILLEFEEKPQQEGEVKIDRLGFKSNFIGTDIYIEYENLSGQRISEHKKTITLTGVLYFTLENCSSGTYTAVASGEIDEVISGEFIADGVNNSFIDNEQIINLEFEIGTNLDDTGNTNIGGDDNGDDNISVHVSTLMLSKNSLYLKPGDTDNSVYAMILPYNATNKSVIWSININ